MIIHDTHQAAQALQAFVQRWQPITVLTGAGISTDSGVPAYRDEHGNWKASEPMTHQEFVAHVSSRQRYWARSLHGWPQLYEARPNRAHQILAAWQQQGLVDTIITQNVDGLHQRAGSESVINLHGNANVMICLDCQRTSPRLDMHQRCLDMNPHYASLNPSIRPDGDAHIEGDFADFKVPNCSQCGGILKPDVVYFGANVPRPRVEQAQQALHSSGGLLVIGSSLTVFSGFRFARQAYQQQQPICLLNLGATRADDLATLKLMAPITPTLQHGITSSDKTQSDISYT